jgi:hypothetical protein
MSAPRHHPGYIKKFVEFQSNLMTARQAQRRLDVALRTRSTSPGELQRLQEQAEILWTKSDKAGSEFARAKMGTTGVLV